MKEDWKGFYRTAFWLRRRKLQLNANPLCKFCLARGVVTPATVADHIKPHKGDWNLFMLGELQSLCDACHNSVKRSIELHGFSSDVGVDGRPLDPNHPANRS